MATNTDYTLTPAAGQATQGNPQRAVGKVVFDSSSITAADYIEITVGFKPRRVRFVNLTDRIEVEWFEGMTADTCLKTAAAGTRTLETTNKGITVGEKTFSVSQNATLAVIAASKDCYFEAWS